MLKYRGICKWYGYDVKINLIDKTKEIHGAKIKYDGFFFLLNTLKKTIILF